MPQIAIHPATDTKDIASVRRLMLEYGHFLSNSPSGAASICLSGYEQELARLPVNYDALLLAEVDGQPAGCVALHEITVANPTGPELACEMKRLWVGPSFRGLGLGRRLIEESLSWATRHDYPAIYLDTVPSAMPEANRLYASLGFHPVERYNRNPVAGVEFFRRPLP